MLSSIVFETDSKNKKSSPPNVEPGVVHCRHLGLTTLVTCFICPRQDGSRTVTMVHSGVFRTCYAEGRFSYVSLASVPHGGQGVK
ncbi:unnamed protein product [Clavelina lepadiformis]|uniref:Uncharacterized protein n=1 Tax=Clavelina lepadiformis TaxID=159417 RepID=A0ABP0FLK3_CLALP